MSCSIFILLIFTVVLVIFVLKKILHKEVIPELDGKHVVVTGGSSGIGKSVAISVSKLGAHVTIIARDKKKLESAHEEISRHRKSGKQEIHYIALDVSENYGKTEEAIHHIEESVGPIFMLVNCVGKAVCNKFENATEQDFRDMMNVNYYSTIYPTQVVSNLMRKRREGHIVMCGSQASLIGIFGMSAYCGAKFALRGFAEALYMEMIPYNVSVTLCLPPDTNTPGYEAENVNKPEETKLISQAAGLFEPDEVARQLLADAMRRRFFSTVGLESFLLTTLCCGMSPSNSISELFLQVSLMSFFRLIGVFYHSHFRKIIFSCHRSRDDKKKE